MPHADATSMTDGEVVRTPPLKIECRRFNSLETNSDSSNDDLQTAHESIRTQRLYRTAYALAQHVLQLRSTSVSTPDERKLAQHLEYLVEKMLTKHRILYKGIIRTLSEASSQLEDPTTAQPANVQVAPPSDMIVLVADQMFADRKVNWGRVVSLFAFLRVYVEHLRTKSPSFTDSDVVYLIQTLARYLSERLGDWITRNGGWPGLVESFPLDGWQNKWESSLLKGLVVTGVGLGVMAGIVALRA